MKQTYQLMKIIKSALLGQKQIIDKSPDVLLLQLKEILKQHRELIIKRLLSDLHTYILFKFDYKPTAEELLEMKQLLLALKDDAIDIGKYETIVNMVLNRAVTHLTNEPFYAEIDEFLAPYIKTKQLKLV